MDGDIAKPPVQERAERPLVDVVARPGVIARAFQSMGGALTLRRPAIDVESPSDAVMPIRRRPWLLLTFLACVVVPALLSDIYLVFIASDQYVAEARAVVRSAEQESAAQSAVASSGSGSSSMSFSVVTPNAYIVTNYIHSRAMVDDLGKLVNLREIFRRPEADFWARLKKDASIEDLVDYWKQMVTTYVDGPSGIVTVKVRAFRREDALMLAEAILKLSETLVNEISERARHDAMAFAEREVVRADGRVRAALIELRRYRDEAGLIDPVKTADETAKLLMQLMTEKIRLESDLFVASRSLTRDAPSVQNLSARIEIIESQIAKLKANLTGESPEMRNVAAKLARFEELEVQRQFAERLYTMAQDGLERARVMAERQSVYLTVFVPPALPEDSTVPRRLAFSILLPLAFLVLWGIASLTWASVQDHRL